MDDLKCYCCGLRLPNGNLRYVVEIKSFADFDGYLDDISDDDIEEEIEELIEYMEGIDAGALEDDICQVLTVVLCKHCRERFMNDPLKSTGGSLGMEEHKETIH